MPIFAEATALASLLLEAPVAILTALSGTSYQIGSIAGLGHLSAMPSNPNLHLELAGLTYCHDCIVSSQSSLSVPDFQQQPQLAQSALLRVHGLRSYLGVPVVTAARDRIGVLAILDFQPRHFSDRQIELLLLVGRLLASEFERKLLSQAQLDRQVGDLQYRVTSNFDDAMAAAAHATGELNAYLPQIADSTIAGLDALSTPAIAMDDRMHCEPQFELLTHIAQELRSPLTSVLGMASVLQQEIYGPLTAKQKDYLGIIHQSGRQLVEIVNEISQLGGLVGDASTLTSDPHRQPSLALNLVDLEMLCQLAIQSLEPIAAKKQQRISLDLSAYDRSSTAHRLWLLDREKVRQIIYYLALSAIHASAIDRQISIQPIQFPDLLQIQITTDDAQAIFPIGTPSDSELPLAAGERATATIPPDLPSDIRINLGLSLSHRLAAAHGGRIELIPRHYRLCLPLLVAEIAADPTQN
jgi:signal transduction histidine kinase